MFVVIHQHLDETAKGITETVIGPWPFRHQAENMSRTLNKLPYSESEVKELVHPREYTGE
jgi:hypothetical protein